MNRNLDPRNPRKLAPHENYQPYGFFPFWHWDRRKMVWYDQYDGIGLQTTGF